MKSYKPKITEAQAQEFLTIRGRIFKSKKIIPHRIELVYLPYYFFPIRVRSNKGIERKFLAAIDGILGSFALVDDSAMEEQDLAEAEFQPQISAEQARESLLHEAKWFLYQKSFRSKEKYKLIDAGNPELGWYPFWVAFYKNKGGAWEFLGLDAVSGVLQGGRGRRLFIHAFADLRLKPER